MCYDALQLPELLREEEQAYNAQSICLPLRRLAASASTEAEHDALVGGPGLSSTADATSAQQHAKQVREAQQDELKKQTGDTLYPASGQCSAHLVHKLLPHPAPGVVIMTHSGMFQHIFVQTLEGCLMGDVCCRNRRAGDCFSI